MQKAYSIIAVAVIGVLVYFFWTDHNNSADTIRQLKAHNSNLETRLTTAIDKSDNLDKRLERSQAEVIGLRQTVTELIDRVATITEREQRNQEIVRRSLDRVTELESLIDEIGGQK